MPRYYFSLTNCRPFEDTDGLDLPDLAAAREEANGFACDMMRLEPGRRDWLDWAVRVTDQNREHLFDLPFREALP